MPDQVKYASKLRDSRILIIGGSSGLGYGVAEATVESGAIVTISSSNSSRVESKVEALKKAYPSAASRIRGVVVDLSKADTLEAELENLFQETVKDLPGQKLDHVVFTAGDALSMMSIQEMSMQKILAAGQIRFFAPLLTAKFIERYVEKSYKSSYVITTGGISEHPNPKWSVIGAYAGGHHSMVRNLALDLKPIRVNGISPGLVDTELWRMSEEEKQGLFKIVSQKMATGNPGRVEDVVESYLACLKDWNMDADIVRTNGGGMIM